MGSAEIISLVIGVIKFGIEHEPAVVDSIREVLKKNDPTVEDWDAEIARVRSLDFRTLVPDNTLPPAGTPNPPSAA